MRQGMIFEAAEEVVIPYSIWKAGLMNGIQALTAKDVQKAIKPTLVPTGIKSYMGKRRVFTINESFEQSSQTFLLLTNGVGVIDSDYYNNSDNEGHIMFQFTNFGPSDLTIKKVNELVKGSSCRFKSGSRCNQSITLWRIWFLRPVIVRYTHAVSPR